MSNSNLTTLPPRSEYSLNRKPRKGLKVVLILLLLCIAGGAGYAGYLYYKFDHMLDKASAPDSEVKTPKAESAKVKAKVLLLLGLDSRPQTGTLNTDVIMIAALNPERKSAAIVSIPRDAYLKPEGYLARKANAFYSIAVRTDENPEQEIKRIFGSYLEVPIDYVSVINFKTFEDVVDELGGIMVDVDMDMRYVDSADGTSINLQKGYQELDGKNALDFVRYRKSNITGPSSDFQRNERQQRVIAAVVDQLKSVGGALKLGDIFDAVGDNIHTDIPKNELKSLIGTYIGISNENIEYIPLNGEWESPYAYLNETEFENAKNRLQKQLK